MLLLYFLLWTAVAANREPLYGKIGDKAVLTSDSVVNPITSIEWKHGPDLAMEWYGSETFSYRHFKDRGSLNTSTGALTITGLTPDDSGSYTVEINNKVTSKTQLLVISPVSKPTISIWCSMTYCVFTCNGNTTGAEPVTYWWTSGDTTWSSTKEHKITMKEKELWFSWFSCAFENPVSNIINSEEVFNPFIRNQLIAIAILLLVVCIIIITFRHKGIINFSCEWIKELLKWTFIYILVCVLVVFNFILIFDSNYEGIQELLTRVFIMIAVFGVILVGFIIFIIYFLYKAGYFAMSLKWMIIFIAVLFLDMFNIIINLIYEGRREDLTRMSILIAVFGVILVGFIITIYVTFKRRNLYRVWRVMYMMPCMSGLFNIIILMYRAINEDLIWMIILTAIFGVILVGFIIVIIYLMYKDTNWQLKWMLILIAVCIPVVFNIINSLYRAIRGGLTWMIILTAIFGVILVGFIISIIIIYLKYRDKLWYLRWMIILTAICISGVFNIIINLIYEGSRKGDLTWMFNFIPVCMLVGFIIIIIYLIYRGITFSRRKRREREAAERDLQAFHEKRRTGEAVDRTEQEYLEWKKKGEVAERKWKEYHEWRRKEFQERWDMGEAERKWQAYLQRRDMGEAAETRWQEYLKWKRKGDAAERAWEDFPERRREGEADERKWKEYLEWRRKVFHEKRKTEGAAERTWQAYLQRRDLGEAAERKWQEILKRRKQGEAAERRWQEYLERLDKEMSEMLPPVENPSTQDPTSVVTQDPSNETEESPMIPDNAETRC